MLVSGTTSNAAFVYYQPGVATDGVYNVNATSVPSASFGAASTEPRKWSFRVQLTPSGPPPSAPTSTAPPIVSGTPQQGQMLTASTGTWSGSPTSYAYQWRRCDAGGSNCAAITAATSSVYLVQPADVGGRLVARVTASNAGGAGLPADSAATAVVTSAPVPVEFGVAGGLRLGAAGADVDLDDGDVVGCSDLVCLPVAALRFRRGELRRDLGCVVVVVCGAGCGCRGHPSVAGDGVECGWRGPAGGLCGYRCRDLGAGAGQFGVAGGLRLGAAGADVDLDDGDVVGCSGLVCLPVAPLRYVRCRLCRHRHRDSDGIRPPGCRRRGDDSRPRHRIECVGARRTGRVGPDGRGDLVWRDADDVWGGGGGCVVCGAGVGVQVWFVVSAVGWWVCDVV